MLRSLVFLAVFYINTALFLVLGSWLLLAPRSWAMEGLRLHGRGILSRAPSWRSASTFSLVTIRHTLYPGSLDTRN